MTAHIAAAARAGRNWLTTPFDGSAAASGVLQLSIVVEQSPQGPWITGLHYQ